MPHADPRDKKILPDTFIGIDGASPLHTKDNASEVPHLSMDTLVRWHTIGSPFGLKNSSRIRISDSSKGWSRYSFGSRSGME